MNVGHLDLASPTYSTGGATFASNHEKTFGKLCGACGEKYKTTDEAPDHVDCAHPSVAESCALQPAPATVPSPAELSARQVADLPRQP